MKLIRPNFWSSLLVYFFVWTWAPTIWVVSLQRSSFGVSSFTSTPCKFLRKVQRILTQRWSAAKPSHSKDHICLHSGIKFHYLQCECVPSAGHKAPPGRYAPACSEENYLVSIPIPVTGQPSRITGSWATLSPANFLGEWGARPGKPFGFPALPVVFGWFNCRRLVSPKDALFSGFLGYFPKPPWVDRVLVCVREFKSI